ncbi:RdgB/HAM1 family non-canonical purine NTP pyrophosphatase [bacterium]|nr:RdgB/HAM1 family non-canonical purine NTP pyrophosphatase [bacterium]
MKIVLATSNSHKVKEINLLVEGLDIEFVLPPDDFDPVEDGKTFEENSLIKAREAWKLSRNWVLADDSGLCIDSLNGAPGIHSARYADTPQARIDRVLTEMKSLKNRTARFKCAMTLINPDGEVAFSYLGVCEGSIITEQRGVNGFGYDPIFLVDGLNQTMAEVSEEMKNKISHRGKALKKVLEYLATLQ